MQETDPNIIQYVYLQVRILVFFFFRRFYGHAGTMGLSGLNARRGSSGVYSNTIVITSCSGCGPRELDAGKLHARREYNDFYALIKKKTADPQKLSVLAIFLKVQSETCRGKNFAGSRFKPPAVPVVYRIDFQNIVFGNSAL